MVNSILHAGLLVTILGLGLAVQASCGDDTAALAGAKVPNPVGYTLPKDTRIKLSLDVELTSAWVKRHDYVQFLVAQNVYGIADDGQRIVVVPASSKVFGVADFTRSRYPFFIKGKAKLYVYVNSLMLENGKCISIQFAEPLQAEQRPDRKPDKHQVQDCKQTVQQCITGRRSKLTFPPGVIGAGANSGVVLIKDSSAGPLAAVTFIQALAGASGIDGLVNPPNAELHKAMVFDVVTTEENKGKLTGKSDK